MRKQKKQKKTKSIKPIESVESVENQKKCTHNTLREYLQQFYEEDLLFMEEDGFDEAIIGVAEGIRLDHHPCVVYDLDKVLEVNIKNSNNEMTPEESSEYFDFNQGGAYVGENTPIFVRTVPKFPM